MACTYNKIASFEAYDNSGVQVDFTKIASNIEQRADGIWAARTESSVSYPEAGNESCFTVEDSSFWFRHRNSCIVRAMTLFPPSGTFFDVGGGNGYVARAVQEAGFDVVVVEPGLTGAFNAKNRGIHKVIRSTLHDAGFLPQTLPAVGLFDVLEHIEDDRAFLHGINRLLIPQGRIYITVPAFQSLWSHEDHSAGHWRRYTLATLSAALKVCGYNVEFASYFFGFLPLPILLFRVLPYRLGLRRKREGKLINRSDHNPNNSYLAPALQVLTRRELSKIGTSRKPRIGGSCIVVAQKLTSVGT